MWSIEKRMICWAWLREWLWNECETKWTPRTKKDSQVIVEDKSTAPKSEKRLTILKRSKEAQNDEKENTTAAAKPKRESSMTKRYNHAPRQPTIFSFLNKTDKSLFVQEEEDEEENEENIEEYQPKFYQHKYNNNNYNKKGADCPNLNISKTKKINEETPKLGNQKKSSSSSTAAEPNPMLDIGVIDTSSYNPIQLSVPPPGSQFFVIKSYSEDDVFRSIKYNVWCSTDHGNRKLDAAYKAAGEAHEAALAAGNADAVRPAVYLFFSVNASGFFCGMAEMTSAVDYKSKIGVWAMDKWRGCFKVWHFYPFLHIHLL